MAAEMENFQDKFRMEQMQFALPDTSAWGASNNDDRKVGKDFLKDIRQRSKRNLTRLPNLASVCDNYNISNNDGAGMPPLHWLITSSKSNRISQSIGHKTREMRLRNTEKRGSR